MIFLENFKNINYLYRYDIMRNIERDAVQTVSCLWLFVIDDTLFTLRRVCGSEQPIF